MGGAMSRNKGRRGEQQLVLHLAKLGFKAERILRQYQESGQPDVVATRDGKTYTFENKCRRDSFKSIYGLYYSERDPNKVLCFLLSPGSTAVAVSSDVDALLAPDLSFLNLTVFPPSPQHLKVYKRIVTLNALRQSADFLVLRDNQKPSLFLRFWG